MVRSTRDIHRDVVIPEYIEATDAAMGTLQEWRELLTRWLDGGPVTRADLERAITLLAAGGLLEWLEWGSDRNPVELTELVTDKGRAKG